MPGFSFTPWGAIRSGGSIAGRGRCRRRACGGPALPLAAILTTCAAIVPVRVAASGAAVTATVAPNTVGLASFDKLWDYDRPDSSEARFLAFLPRARAAGDSALVVEVLTQVARAQGLQGDFVGALGTLLRAESRLADGMAIPRVRVLLERGRAFNSYGKPDEARPLFLEAWESARKAGSDFHAVDAAHMMGIIEPDSSALVWNERAIALAETSGDQRTRGWLAPLYNNAGWTHHDAGRYEVALSYFEKALVLRQERNDVQGSRIARWSVARCKRSLGRTREALDEQQALLEEITRANAPDGYVNEEIAECLNALGRAGEAKPHFAKAYALLSQDPWFVENESERLARLKSLGEVR